MEYTLCGIRAAGHHLFDVLATEKGVAYSRFYNAAPDTLTSLAASLWRHIQAHGNASGYEGPDDPSLTEFCHLLVEEAVWQLEDLGVVSVAFLDNRLIDGHPDFRITLTARGERFLADGRPFGFRGYGDRIRATEASEWLISFLDAGGPGQTLTLRDVMEIGESEEAASVTDESGNTYGMGTRSYAWAFEVSMWYHARTGTIEPVFETPDQRATWEAFFAKHHKYAPPRPDLTVPHPLWDVPFRLTPKGSATEQVRHVGWMGGE